jgi:hypothetical protein
LIMSFHNYYHQMLQYLIKQQTGCSAPGREARNANFQKIPY